jgi:hypothetical protein
MKSHGQNNQESRDPNAMIREAVKKALAELGEYAECVVILASTTENKKTYLITDYIGNRFAAEKMAEVFCEHFNIEEEYFECKYEKLEDDEEFEDENEEFEDDD